MQRHKKQEERVAKALAAADIPFTREERISFSCVRENKQQNARLDFVIYSSTRIIALEVDEDQHAGYNFSCELARMADVQSCLLLGGDSRPLVFIRYNPHVFRVNDQVVFLKKRQREVKLAAHIKHLLASSAIQPFEIHFMFFDSADGERPLLCADPDWASNWDACTSLLL